MKYLFSLSPILVASMLIVVSGCKNPAEGVPEAKIETPTDKQNAGSDAPTSSTVANGRKYPLGSGSSVEFTGSKVTGSHSGGFKSVAGAFTSDGTPENTSLSVTVDVASMWSDSDRLTKHLSSPDFLDIKKFTSATFRSTAITPQGGQFSVSGDLSMHGATQRLSFPASITITADEIKANAEFVIKRFDFGINYPGKADDLIRDEVVLKVTLEAKAE